MLDALFTPGRVAVMADAVGEGSVGRRLVERLVEGGFGGEVVVVCEGGGEVAGRACVGEVGDAAGPLDLALIAVEAAQVKRAVGRAARAGARAVVVTSGGFRGAGDAGEKLERGLVQECEQRGVGLLGPMSLGVINVQHRMNASGAPTLPQPGGISIISQSGALTVALLSWAARRRLGLAKVVCVGDKAGFSEVDLLRELTADPATTVIVAYLESIKSGRAFMKAAERAARHKPVIVLKAGVTPAGVRAAAAHTGQLADANIAYGAAFRRSGVVHALTVEALLDYASAFERAPLPGGDRVAIVTTGGSGVLAADAVDRAGLRVVGGAGNANGDVPVEVRSDSAPEQYEAAVEAVRADDGVDAVILALAPHAMARPLDTLRALCQSADQSPWVSKPILASWLGGDELLGQIDDPVRCNFPDYPSPERAVAALQAMVDYAAWRRRPPRIVTRFPVNRRRVDRILTHHVRAGQLELSEVRSKEVFRAYNFAVPEGSLATSADEAVEIAERIGLPVVLKIDSPDIPHKTAAGALRLNLGNPEAVRDAFDLLMLRISERLPDARVNGVFVERMGFSGREVLLGMQRDPQFGPMLLFGLGGIVVETMEDVSFNLAPITGEEAMQMLQTTRAYELLRGAPGRHGVDLQSIANGLQRLSQLATDFPLIAELDISPFIVGDAGAEPYVADARIVLSTEAPHG
jgi:acetate---CoA ligase (ADP-forming)